MADRALRPLLVGAFEHYSQRTMARLGGLSDDEYLWEPVPGCWTVRRDPDGGGAMVADGEVPPPEPPPFTTIAWRMVHICSFLQAHGLRAVAFERGQAAWDAPQPPVPESASAALAAMTTAIAAWRRALATVEEDRLWEPMGPAAGPFADGLVSGFVEHIHDEFVHHTAELGLLRDLYRAGSIPSRS